MALLTQQTNSLMNTTENNRLLVLHVVLLASLCAITCYCIFSSNVNFFAGPADSVELIQGKLHTQKPSNQVDPLNQSKDIQLPYDASQSEHQSKQAWFRFTFDLSVSQQESVSIYIPTVRQNVAIYLNGHWVGKGGDFEPYLARLWSYPQLFELPISLFEQSNILEIKLESHREQVGYLSKIYIGNTNTLNKSWQWRYTIKVTWLQVVSILLVVIGLVNLYLWSLRKKDTYYLWYSLAAFCWGARGFLLISPIIPITDELRLILRILTLGYGITFVVLFIQRYFGFRNRRLDIALFVYCVPCVIPMFFMNIEQLVFYAHQVWVKGNLALGIMLAAQLLYFGLKRKQLDALYLLYCGLPLLIMGFRDMLVLIHKWSPENGFLINHATIPAMIVAMWFILRRLSNSLNYAENLNVSLEERVQESNKEIIQSYKKNQQMVKRQLLSDERERIMRDMHDGVGGHLIGIKSLLDSAKPKMKEVNSYVDRALVDLRFVINSLDPGPQQISSILGSLRNRWQQLAQSKNCELIWRVTRVQANKPLGPDKTLQLMRILEEAYINAVKHGDDHSDIIVSSGYAETDHHLWIQIQNAFTSKPKEGQGRGLTNMTRRAQTIGWQIVTKAQGHHFNFRIQIPIGDNQN
ncbi:MAG: hypothetical protein KTR16_01775 [Acidiferrobacterales bacterium]|nr:hypothetical protein [Acidiferrobacterales bacterium]